MTWKHPMFALAALMIVPSWLLGADGQGLLAEQDAQVPVFSPRLGFDSAGDLAPIVRGQSTYRSETVARFGWWATTTDGDLLKTGEWQGLDSNSAFFDVDGLFSDGSQTADFYATGTEDESTQTGLYVYRPLFSADINYQRFIHRLEHDPLDNFSNNLFPSQPRFDAQDGNLTNPGSLNRAMMQQDLNVGDEYAIRVQEFEADFKGRLTQNVNWRLDLWGMRKYGERQSRSASHCFNGTTVDTGTPTVPAVPAGARACHVLNQQQRIDWLTMEIEPVIEGRWGPLDQRIVADRLRQKAL